MMKRLGLALILSISIPLRGLAAERCESVFESAWPSNGGVLFKKDFKYTQIAAEHLTRGVLHASALGSENAVFIGITPEAHTYIVAGKTRFDGEFFIGTPDLRKTDLLSDGIVVRLRDSDGSLRKQVEEFLAANGAPKAFNCVQGACKVLGGTDLRKGDEQVRAILPHRLLEKITSGELQHAAGDRVETDVFVLGDMPVSSLVNNMKVRTVHESVMFGMPAISVGAVIAAIIVLIDRNLRGDGISNGN